MKGGKPGPGPAAAFAPAPFKATSAPGIKTPARLNPGIAGGADEMRLLLDGWQTVILIPIGAVESHLVLCGDSPGNFVSSLRRLYVASVAYRALHQIDHHVIAKCGRGSARDAISMLI